jgi:KUP system potassium uptake protein
MGEGTKFVPGDAIFLTGTPNIVPHAMLHNIKHNKVLHERNIMLTVITRDIPFVDRQERIELEKLSEHFYRVFIYYGFKDQPNIPEALQQAYEQWNFEYDLMQKASVPKRFLKKTCRHYNASLSLLVQAARPPQRLVAR